MGCAAVARPQLLVIEDDPDILSLVRGTLEAEGCAVTPAASLPASLALLKEQLFHLIVTDLFREQEHDPLLSIHALLAEAAPTPVGVITGWQVSEEAANQAGLSFLLYKPFDLDDLVQAVQHELSSILSQRRQTQLVEQFFVALGTGDWQRLAQFCTPDLIVLSLSTPAMASLSQRRGLSSYLAFLEQRFRALPGYAIEEVLVFARPLGLAARYTVCWQSRNGLPHRAVGSMRFRFEGERIAQIETTL
jgi:CheY-like chemotaxis protein/predicted ester cyclase